MKMATTKLAFAAVLVLLLCMHCELVQAMELRRSLPPAPRRMTTGSAVGGVKPLVAGAVQSSSDKGVVDEKVPLAPLVAFIRRYKLRHFAGHPVSHSCFICIADHCGWNASIRCVKKAMSKCT